MEFEEKDSSDSGSQVESESPPPLNGGVGVGEVVVPQVMNMAMNMSTERSLVVPNDGGNIGGMMGEKKKRGRPRKYDSNGNLRVPYMVAASGGADTASSPQGFTLTTPPSAQFSSSGKRGRGRGLGSGNWQNLSSLGELLANTAGGDFTPHVVTVYTGEDVAGKILTFAQKGTRGVCVLSANGSVSNVTIRQPSSSGGILTYEGRFEILTLTGSYTLQDNGGMKSRTGGLSVSLAGPDGRVIGGGVAGMLIAASPIQIVVGSFTPNANKMLKRRPNPEPRLTPIHGAPSPGSLASPHHIALPRVPSVSAAGSNIFPPPASQLPVQSRGEADHSTSHFPHPVSTVSANWNGTETSAEQWPTPDINLSAPMEQ